MITANNMGRWASKDSNVSEEDCLYKEQPAPDLAWLARSARR